MDMHTEHCSFNCTNTPVLQISARISANMCVLKNNPATQVGGNTNSGAQGNMHSRFGLHTAVKQHPDRPK